MPTDSPHRVRSSDDASEVGDTASWPSLPAGRGLRRERLGDPGREVALSGLGIAVTLVATVGVVVTVLSGVDGVGGLALGVLFVALVGGLLWGNLAYQVSRLGFHARRRDELEHPSPDRVFDGTDREVLVLVPSYREELGVIRQTLVSAGLQAYPGVRVVLLVDDPPSPVDPEHQRSLADALALPAELERWLAAPHELVRNAELRFVARSHQAGADLATENERLAAVLGSAAGWLEEQARAEEVATHTDATFVQQAFIGPAHELRSQAGGLRELLAVGLAEDWSSLRMAYRRLCARFGVEFSVFQRKRYENLSHEPNKAMNLNAYLSLLGARWREEERSGLLHLVPAGDGDATIDVSAPPFVVTLDADSIIHPDYVATLVSVAEKPGNERVAVLQTPYSAVPDAPGALERIAGATTDMQYVAHQGFARFDAAFWVGANALIRTKALHDIEETVVERGHPVSRFVSDRTVIEDTESSLDLAARGWSIHNHPERLSFSATPPDFGSLVVQRRRWANGGVLLAPKLASVVRAGAVSPVGLLLRGHYLLSISLTNVALVLLLFSGFGSAFASWWLPLSALPYFALYARDLHQAGYRYRDIGPVYALNLLLVPTNLGGVAKSVEQGIRRTKTPFARTPKVEGHTPAPPAYHLATLAMVGLCGWAVAWDLLAGEFVHAIYAAFTGAVLVYAVTTFVGWRSLLTDVRAGLSTRV